MYTIDDLRTRDMDDAVSVQRTDTGWAVRVSIADVAKFVPPGSDLDKTARDRGATQYLASGNNPMLPRDLAEWKLSLFPHKPRRSLNVEILLSRSLEVLEKTIVRGSVTSKAKLNYAEIPSILLQSDHPFHQEVLTARDLALDLLLKRRNAGALIFYDLNKGWVTTEDGTIKRMKHREDTIGYVIIQELMILTNVVVAAYLSEHDIPTLFRNHELRGIDPGRQTLIEEMAGMVDAPVVDLESLQRRSNGLFKRAEYGAVCLGHYGLNEKAYVHFTSPIRRYADLVVHQQLRAHLKGEPLPHSREDIEAVAAYLNELNQAERERSDKVHAARREREVQRNIETKKLDELPLKDFEQVVSYEIRTGEPASDSLTEAWMHRLAQGTLTNACLTEVLMLDGTEGWNLLREAAVEYLGDRPADAAAVFNQAQMVGWSAPELDCQQTGPAHQPSFRATAHTVINQQAYMAAVTCKIGGSAKLVKQRALVELLKNIVYRQLGKQDAVEVEAPAAAVKAVEGDPSKNPVSVLMELSQARKVAPPVFSFETSGPSHAPIMTCTANFLKLSVKAVAASKQDAKKAAATALLEKLG